MNVSLRIGDGLRATQDTDYAVRKIKLIAPSPPNWSVERKGIADLVARAGHAKLVLFRAPAGFGKTVTMRQYFDQLRNAGTATAWLTLDRLDDDYRRFLRHLVVAADRILSVPGALPVPGIHVPAAVDVDQLAVDLINRISDCDHPFTLFIDEFESVSNRAIDDLVGLLLNRLPQHGQLAIATRGAPSLELGSLRARGQLIEVGQFQLRFSREEAAQFLRGQRGLDLSEGSIGKLYDDTEGWPAALQLALTTLDNHDKPESFIAAFSGSSTAVADYLAEDVLSHQTVDVQSFLLRTSILGELSKPLCDAVCGRGDGEAILEHLERFSICTTVFDGERHLYRYHPLFSTFLRDRLARMLPDEIPALHLKAAKWFEAERRPMPAIEHALASGEMEFAFRLLERHADNLLFQGRFNTLIRWFGTLSEESLLTRPGLQTAHIWALTFTGRSSEALRLLDAVEKEQLLASRKDKPALEMVVLRAFTLCALDRVEEGFRLAEDALSNNTVHDGFHHSVLITLLATWLVAKSRYSQAVSLLRGVNQENGVGGESFLPMYSICIEGVVDLVQGRVRQAIAHFRVALSDAAAAFGSRSIGKSITAVYLAQALYEIDEFQEAEQILALYIPIIREYAMPDLVIISHVLLTRFAYESGDVDQAFRRLSELEWFGRQGNLPRAVAAARLERTRLALLREDPSEAQYQYGLASDAEVWEGFRDMDLPSQDVETPELSRFRLAVRGIGPKRSLQSLKECVETARSAMRHRRRLKLEMLYAKMLYDDGQRRLALRKLGDVLEVACAQGLVRTFIDEGAPVMELLREFRMARKTDAVTDKDDELIRFVDRILHRAGCGIDETPVEEAPAEPSVCLSRREQQVLESVALGLSNNAIASRIFLTETTVRSHLRNINVKLGAANRTQAVNLARRMGLIR